MKISLNEDSINAAIAEIDKKSNELAMKMDLATHAVAVAAKDIMSSIYSSAFYDGVNDISVAAPTMIENGWSVVANGNAVAFIEFGAGVAMGHGYPGTRPAGIVDIGEYGLGQGKNPDGWWYPTETGYEHTYGNSPYAAIYNAMQTARSIAPGIIREKLST